MMPSKAEVCVRQLEQVAEELSKGYTDRAARRLDALCQLAQHTDTFEGWVTQAAAFTLLLQTSVTAPQVSKPYEVFLERVLLAAVDLACGSEVHALSSDVAALLSDIIKQKKWPLHLQVFNQLQAVRSEDNVCPNQMNLPVPHSVHLDSFSVALKLCEGGVRLLTCLSRANGFVGPSEAVLRDLAALCLRSESLAQVEVFVVALEDGMRERWSLPGRVTMDLVQKAIADVMVRYCMKHGDDLELTRLDLASCGILDFAMTSGRVDSVVKMMCMMMKHPPQRTKLREWFLRTFFKGLGKCSKTGMPQRLLQDLLIEPTMDQYSVHQIKLLASFLDNGTNLAQLKVENLVAEKAAEWIEFGVKEFTSPGSLQALSVLAVSLISQALCKTISLSIKDKVLFLLSQLLEKKVASNAHGQVHVQDFLLSLCVDCVSNENTGDSSPSYSSKACETLLGDKLSTESRAVGISFLPFVHALESKTANECALKLMEFCKDTSLIIRRAVGQAMCCLPVAFGDLASRELYLSCVGQACSYANRDAVKIPFTCPFVGSIGLQLSVLEPFCRLMPEELDPHFLKVRVHYCCIGAHSEKPSEYKGCMNTFFSELSTC